MAMVSGQINGQREQSFDNVYGQTLVLIGVVRARIGHPPALRGPTTHQSICRWDICCSVNLFLMMMTPQPKIVVETLILICYYLF